MKTETCFNCYYHSSCKKEFSTEEQYLAQWCENWKPAVIPCRAIEAFYAEFLSKSRAALDHTFNRDQAAAMEHYLVIKGEQIKSALDTYKFCEMPQSTDRDNRQYHNFIKNKNKRP